MRWFGWGVLATALVGCGSGLQCGTGTREEDGFCVADLAEDAPDDDPADTDVAPADTEETDEIPPPVDTDEEQPVDPEPDDLPPFFGEVIFIDTNGMAAFCAAHEVVYGDVTIRGSLIAELSQLACLRMVVGDLTITADQLQAVTLPNLVRIDGDLSIRGLAKVQAIDLPALRRVTGSLSLGGGSAFPTAISIDLPALTEVGVDLWLTDTTTLAQIELPALTTVGRHLWFRRHAAVQRIHAPALSTLGGALRFDDNAALTDVDLSALTEVGADVTGELAIEGNGALAVLSGLHGISAVSGSLVIRNNPLLPTAECDALRDAIGVDQITGRVEVSGNGTAIVP